MWVNGTSSRLETMQYGVPQGSVLRPSCFLLYTADLDVIVTNHVAFLCEWLAVVSLLSSWSDPTAVSRQDRVHYGRRLMNEVKHAAKTEFLWPTTLRRLHYFNDSPLILGNTVKPTTIARNLEVTMNRDFFQWCPTSISWLSLVSIHWNRFGRFNNHSLSMPPGS